MDGHTKIKVPMSKPYVTSDTRRLVLEAVESSYIGTGPFIQKFEEVWAKENNYRFGSACSSGTAALHLALTALDIGEGDEVIVPEFTMVATAWAVTYTGARPVFVDCDNTLNIDIAKIESAITAKTKAIIVVHVYGRRVNMNKIAEIAIAHDIAVVEDSAEAHGILPEKSDIACFSFYSNKIISTGEGGMCLTNSRLYKDRIDTLRSMSFDKNRTYLHPHLGFNYRMTNIQAAIGLSQLETLGWIKSKRRMIEMWYDAYLPAIVKMPKRDVLWYYDIDTHGDAEQLKNILLNEYGIETRSFFKPMSMQPMYSTGQFPTNAMKWGQRGLLLPTYMDITEEQVKYVCECIAKSLPLVV